MSTKEDSIDWDDIKWGSFSKQMERYNHTHAKKMKDLTAFAKMILKAPHSKYHEKTRKRANFYLSVLKPKPKPREKRVTQSQKQNVVVNITHPKRASRPRKSVPKSSGMGQGHSFIQTSNPVPFRMEQEHRPLYVPQKPIKTVRHEVEAMLDAAPETPARAKSVDEWIDDHYQEPTRGKIPRGRPKMYTPEEAKERAKEARKRSNLRRREMERQVADAASQIEREGLLGDERETDLSDYFTGIEK